MQLKKLLRAGKKYLCSSEYRFLINAGLGFFDRMPDEEYLKRKFRARMGRELNLDHPQTFNEKLQWLKLYDRKPEYTMMVDKVKVRDYIAETIGEEYLIPLLGVWEDPEDIDFDALPNQFVLKCNHNSGLGMCICKDKTKLDIPKVKRELKKGLDQDYYLTGREWPYKNVPRRILAEKYMEDTENDVLTDYKFFCFHGKAKIMYISKDHSADPRTDFFDMDFNHLPIRARDPHSDVTPSKPVRFNEMRCIAEELSKNIPHLRVDFFCVNEKLYVGELTFFHMSGFTNFTPEDWNLRLGSWIELSKDNQ